MILFVDNNNGILFLKNIIVDIITKTAQFISKITKIITRYSEIN